MRLQYKRHLEWLCIENQSDTEIERFYDTVQLPIPPKAVIDAARESTSKLPIVPVARRNLARNVWAKGDNPYWEKIGFGEIHLRRCGEVSKEWEEVGRLLNHPVMRIALDCAIITGFPMEKIPVMLSQSFGNAISDGGIELYKKYFADFKAMDRTDYRTMLDLIRGDHYSYVRYFAALTKPQDEVLHLCGLPTAKQFSDFLRNVLATADYKFKYYSRQNNPDADSIAKKWAKVGIEAGEKFEKYGAADATDFAQLVMTEFEYIDPDIPTIEGDMAKQLLPAAVTDDNKPENSKAPPPPKPNSDNLTQSPDSDQIPLTDAELQNIL